MFTYTNNNNSKQQPTITIAANVTPYENVCNPINFYSFEIMTDCQSWRADALLLLLLLLLSLSLLSLLCHDHRRSETHLLSCAVAIVTRRYIPCSQSLQHFWFVTVLAFEVRTLPALENFRFQIFLKNNFRTRISLEDRAHVLPRFLLDVSVSLYNLKRWF